MKRIVAAGALVLSCAVPQVSTAAPITMHFEGMGNKDVVRIQSPRFNALWVYAGEMDWSWVGPPPSGFASWFYSYCVDINDYELPNQTVTVDSTDNLTTYYTPPAVEAGKKAAWLFNTYAPAIRSGSGASANAQAAALQVAIWEVLYDGPAYTMGVLNPSTMLAGGNFALLSGSSAVTGLAKDYLSALFGGSGSYHTSTAAWLNTFDDGASGQDQITAEPVPEPVTVLLFGSGIVALALRRRRGV